jgi:ATP-binding cassette subfamily B protein
MKARLNTLSRWRRQAVDQVPHLLRALGLVWAASRTWTAAWLVLLVVQGLLPAATVRLTKPLVDSLVDLIESGGSPETLQTSLLLAILMGLLMLLSQLLSSLTGWVSTAQAEVVKDHVTSLIHRQSIKLDLSFYDSADYYDHLHRARAEAGFRPLSLLQSIGGLLQNSITLAAMAAVLVPYGAWLPLALLVSTIPAFYVVLIYNRREHRWWLKRTADERRTRYFDWLLTDRRAAAEMRLFKLGNKIQNQFQKLRKMLREQRLALIRNQTLARLGATAAGLLVTAGVLVWMVWQALQGLYTLGDLALFYQAFNQGQGLMRTLLENFGRIYSNSLFLGNLFEFLELEPQVKDRTEPEALPIPLIKGIHFKDVTFRYPGSERTAIRDFILEIPAGKIMAIVGPNGAGKTTLLKLLCRFYDPQSGSIEMDGVDLRDISLDALWGSITILFQEPVHYQDSVAGNIAPGELESKMDLTAVETAARAAGAEEVVAKLPEGYKTPLGKWFEGGTELSVGEWQRIALARAFKRQAPIIVLDEPTSAMDSWAEIDWLKRFRKLAENHTAVIITHRFTTAMYADVIHVMDSGSIIESGSHSELLALGGRYAQSWQSQILGVPQDVQEEFAVVFDEEKNS